jgi:hypothetical protein
LILITSRSVLIRGSSVSRRRRTVGWRRSSVCRCRSAVTRRRRAPVRYRCRAAVGSRGAIARARSWCAAVRRRSSSSDAGCRSRAVACSWCWRGAVRRGSRGGTSVRSRSGSCWVTVGCRGRDCCVVVGVVLQDEEVKNKVRLCDSRPNIGKRRKAAYVAVLLRSIARSGSVVLVGRASGTSRRSGRVPCRSSGSSRRTTRRGSGSSGRSRRPGGRSTRSFWVPSSSRRRS